MLNSLLRLLYRGVLRLHPPGFQREFGDDMLWIYDELVQERDTLSLLTDVLGSLTRQWLSRCSFRKLFLDEIGAPTGGGWAFGLFAWERIGLPERPLPLPRIVQGCIASFAFITTLAALGLGTTNAAPFNGPFSATKEASCVPREAGRGISRRASNEAPSWPNSHESAPAIAEQRRADRMGVRIADSTKGRASAKYRISLILKGRDFFPVFGIEQPNFGSFAVATNDGLAGAAALRENSGPPTAPGTARVLTSQYDNMRTGANLDEKILTPANVNTRQFGKLFAFQVNGDVYAQPLYLPDVEIPGKGRHNVLFVATESDSVYAFDADGQSKEPLWRAQLANPGEGIKPLSESDVSCFFIAPQVGITSTPVIDLQSGTLYVLARTKETKGLASADQYKQKLHALAITTGVEKFAGPVEIKAAITHAGGQISFNPRTENPRAALLVANGSVYLTWASSCDEGPYYGWVMAYDAQTLSQRSVFNTSPDKHFSGIWQGDAGPAADKDGNVFAVTGNGEFDGTTAGRNFGDSVLKFGPDSQHLALADYFTPSNQEQLNARDNDLGSSGPVLLPDQAGPHRHLLLTAGKEGKIYVIDRDNMGKFQPGDDPHAVQTISASHGAFGAMAYWNQNVFFIGSEARLEDFSVEGGQLRLKAAGNTKFLDSGATPAVSSNGKQDGIVWAASSKNWNEQAGRPAVLYAYDASDVHRELYTSEQNGARDRAGVALRFVIPTVVNGRVYLGAKGEVDVYGLLPSH